MEMAIATKRSPSIQSSEPRKAPTASKKPKAAATAEAGDQDFGAQMQAASLSPNSTAKSELRPDSSTAQGRLMNDQMSIASLNTAAKIAGPKPWGKDWVFENMSPETADPKNAQPESAKMDAALEALLSGKSTASAEG